MNPSTCSMITMNAKVRSIFRALILSGGFCGKQLNAVPNFPKVEGAEGVSMNLEKGTAKRIKAIVATKMRERASSIVSKLDPNPTRRTRRKSNPRFVPRTHDNK